MLIKCPTCEKQLRVPDEHAGKRVKCPCGATFQVPAGNQATGGNVTPAPRPPSPRPQATPTASTIRRPTPPGSLGTLGSPGPGTSAAPSAFDRSEVASMFDGISDADLVATVAPKIKTVRKKDPLAGVMLDDKPAQKREAKKGAAKNVYSSIWILVGLGLFHIILNGFLFWNAEKEVRLVVTANPEGDIDPATLLFLVQCIYGAFVAVGVIFLVCASTVLAFPLTSTIVAMVAFVLSEIIGMVVNPLQLINVRGWIFRAAVFGGLLQAINNASSYKFVKAGGRGDG